MALDLFLMLGPIKGESYDRDYRGEIDVLAWSWGSSHDSQGMSVQPLSVTKYVDSSSPLILALHHRQGAVDAVLTVRKAGERSIVAVRLSLGGVRVQSISMGGSGGEDRLTENVSLSFESLKMEVQPQDDTGRGLEIVEYGLELALPSPG